MDLTVGTNGVIPCAEVNNGANKTGRPIYDRPHNFKLNAAYVRPIGPVNLTFGALTEVISKCPLREDTRTVNVLLPGHDDQFGQHGHLLLRTSAAPTGGGTGVVPRHLVRGHVAHRRHHSGRLQGRDLQPHRSARRSSARNNVVWCGV